jgi:phage virion morphogenesis protein
MASITINDQVSKALRELQEKVVDLRPVLLKIGEIVQESTEDRLNSGKNVDPTGKPWVTLQPWYQKEKKKRQNQILSLEGHLADSITHDVIDGHTAIIGTNVAYSAIHQFGGVIRPKTANALNVGGRLVKKVTIPARPFLGISNDDKENILDAVLDHMASAWQ